MDIVRRLRTGALALAVASAGTLAAAGAVHAQTPVTLQYWVYSDFAQGDALKLQQQFIAEFEAAHPGVKIVISGKGDDDLTTGQVTGAASGNLPDVFMNGLAAGAQLVEAKAVDNIYARWMAMPQEYRDQFDKDAIASCSPKPQVMYCLPYTGFGEIMFRNLTVLKEAGHRHRDPAEGLGGMVRPDEEGQGGRQIRDAGPDAGVQFRRQHLRHRRAGRRLGHRLRHQEDAGQAGQLREGPSALRRHEAPHQRHQPQRPGHQGPVHHQPARLPRRRPLGRSDLQAGRAGFGPQVRFRAGAGRQGDRPRGHQELRDPRGRPGQERRHRLAVRVLRRREEADARAGPSSCRATTRTPPPWRIRRSRPCR